MHTRKSLSVVLTVLAIATLAGCSSDDDKASLTCPGAAILAPTSTLTTFRSGTNNDPAGEVYTAGMVSVKTDCELDEYNGTTDSTLELTFRAKRPAAGEAAGYKVPYYVAVTQAGRVISKETYWASFGFPAGADKTEFVEDVPSTKINLENGKKPFDYELVVGLQLTHDQLDYNKKIGRYAP